MRSPAGDHVMLHAPLARAGSSARISCASLPSALTTHTASSTRAYAICGPSGEKVSSLGVAHLRDTGA